MNKPMNNDDIRRCLWAFADGELDIEQNLAVLERMAMDPAATRRVLHQQQLRQRTAHAMSQPAMQTPDALRTKIQQMATGLPANSSDAKAAPQPQRSSGRSPVLARIGRWMPASIAAVLFLATAALMLMPSQPRQPDFSAGIGNGVAVNLGQQIDVTISNASLAAFDRRHVRCSSDVQRMYNTIKFPTQLQALPGALDSYFSNHFNASAFDLRDIGFDYVRTGECRVPGNGAVHVLYRATPESGRYDTLSLWIRPYDGQIAEMDEGKLYVAANESASHPLLMWRHNNMAFYLVGDTMQSVETAAARLRG